MGRLRSRFDIFPGRCSHPGWHLRDIQAAWLAGPGIMAPFSCCLQCGAGDLRCWAMWGQRRYIHLLPPGTAKKINKCYPDTLHLPVSVAHIKDIMFQSADLLRKHTCGELSCIVLSLSTQKINVFFWSNRSIAWILHEGHLEETDAAPSCSTSSGILPF